MSIYSYNNYLAFLKDSLDSNASNRGFHAQMAKAAGMHPSYLSRILHDSTHLTPDQAAGLCNFWNLDNDQTKYFLNLVHKARAGTPALREIIDSELTALRKKHEELGARLPAENIVIENENIYYSAWYYGVVHLLISIPSFQTELALTEKLGLPPIQVKQILATLEGLELIKKNRNKWQVTKNNIHLKNDSWMATIQHLNWRAKMMERIQMRNLDELHYTGLHTLSRNDFFKIKEILLESLVKVDRTIRPSPEEELCCLLIDWSIL